MENGIQNVSRTSNPANSNQENRFGIQPKMAARVARLGVRIYEVGISYPGGSYAEGEKDWVERWRKSNLLHYPVQFIPLKKQAVGEILQKTDFLNLTLGGKPHKAIER